MQTINQETNQVFRIEQKNKLHRSKAAVHIYDRIIENEK